jgi:DNA-binding MarR family transcriptional regulator
MPNQRTDKTAARAATAETLLETFPSVMGFVASRLRRNAGVDNPVHFRLLRTLRRGPRSLHELAELHGVKLPTMSRTVSVLEGRGWVSRTRSRDDRRTVFASITDEGRAALERVEQLAIDRASELLACLSDEENDHLHAGLEALYRVVLERLGSHYEDGSEVPTLSGCADQGEETE